MRSVIAAAYKLLAEDVTTIISVLNGESFAHRTSEEEEDLDNINGDKSFARRVSEWEEDLDNGGESFARRVSEGEEDLDNGGEPFAHRTSEDEEDLDVNGHSGSNNCAFSHRPSNNNETGPSKTKVPILYVYAARLLSQIVYTLI